MVGYGLLGIVGAFIFAYHLYLNYKDNYNGENYNRLCPLFIIMAFFAVLRVQS